MPASFAIQLSMEGVATTNESHAPEQPLSPLNLENDAVLGELKGGKQQDFSKIQGRFKRLNFLL